VYGDTLKIASGLGHTAKQATDDMRDGENSQDDDDNQANFVTFCLCSVGDPSLFCVVPDPDPWINTSDKWTQIRLQIKLRIRLLSLLILRMQKKFSTCPMPTGTCLQSKIFLCVLKLYFAGIISVRSIHL
jgi:hypothetical protein